MHLVYSLVLTLAFAALLPYFVYQSVRHRKYLGSFGQRLGFLPDSLKSDGKPVIWVHAVSVGEFLAVEPLIRALATDFANHRIVVSTTTATGQRMARERLSAIGLPGRIEAFYFPFDWSWTVRRVLAHVRPSLVVIVETELWPNFLRSCRRKGIPTVIANARISVKSYRRYQQIRFFVSRMMRDVTLVIAQSEEDRERAISLGLPPGSATVCGNLKYDGPAQSDRAASGRSAETAADKIAGKLDGGFALSLADSLVVAGSTAPGEEEIVLEAFSNLRKRQGLERIRLVIAPRHPERFEEVARLLDRSGFSYRRRSTLPAVESAPARSAPDILLLDSIGELAAIYRFATVVFVGGSLTPRGGHNILEPAIYAKPIVVGPYTDNFRRIVEDFERASAVVQIKTKDEQQMSVEFQEHLAILLLERDTAAAMGQRGREFLLNSHGATECVMENIRLILTK